MIFGGMSAWRELDCVSVAVRRRGRKVRHVLVDDRSLRGEVGRVAPGGGEGTCLWDRCLWGQHSDVVAMLRRLPCK